MPEPCSTCGRTLDDHDRHVRFTLPTPLFDLPDWQSKPVVATVIEDDHTPYCTESGDPVMSEVLGNEWPHEQILSTLGSGHALD